MYLRTCLALTLGGLIISILVVSVAGSIATGDLASRIKIVDQTAALSRQLDKIERARRQYQATGSNDHLETARSLIDEASGDIAALGSTGETTSPEAQLIVRLQDSFGRYRELLDAYAASETSKAEANQNMLIELNGMNAMAATLKRERESEYHRTFAYSTSIKEAEQRLKTALRLTTLANEIIVMQMSIERAVALFAAGNGDDAVYIPLKIGRIAEIADRIRRIEQVAKDDRSTDNLPDRLAARSNAFQTSFDVFRLALRDQAERAQAMADVAIDVTQLIGKANALQTEAAVRSVDWTLILSILGVATALFLGGLTAIVVRNRIILPLTAITEAMKKMSSGQLSIAVPGYDRQDELGAMAHALEVFRQTSIEARRLGEENLEVQRRLAEEKAEAAFLEQSLEREKELNAQQRRFVSLVSHEFRTPLAIIDGQAQRLIRKGDKISADRRSDALGKVREAVNRLTDLMESVLSSASLEAGSIAFNPEPMPLRAMVKRACDNQQEISKTHRIDVDIAALPEVYLGDPKLLHQVMTNLLSNAVKYSPEADRVEVTAGSTDDDLEIAVRDFGVGIPQSELGKISERFFRASTSGGIQGTGIGLNLVKALMEMHDGSMTVTSEQGKGSTFTIKLPRQKQAEVTMAEVA